MESLDDGPRAVSQKECWRSWLRASPWRDTQGKQGSCRVLPCHGFSSQFTPQTWSNVSKSKSQQKGRHLGLISTGWWLEVMSFRSSRSSRDAQWRASSGRVDDGYSSIQQKYTQRCSRPDMATRNISSQSHLQRWMSGTGSYGSTNQRRTGWASGLMHTWRWWSTTTDAWRKPGQQKRDSEPLQKHTG